MGERIDHGTKEGCNQQKNQMNHLELTKHFTTAITLHLLCDV